MFAGALVAFAVSCSASTPAADSAAPVVVPTPTTGPTTVPTLAVPETGSVGPTITVRVNLWAVHEEGGQPGVSSDQMIDMASRINTIWAQAGITFEFQVASTTASSTSLDDLALGEFDPFVQDLASGSIVADLSTTSGFFVPNVGLVDGATPTNSRVFFVRNETSNPMADVVAHELGHIFDLVHVDDPTQLMESGNNGVILSANEIATARRAAGQIAQIG